MMYIVTRFFNNGKASAMLTSDSAYQEQTNDSYDQYVESVGEGGDYENVKEWCDDMNMEHDDIADMVADTDKWIDITACV